jgi:TonB-dependent SusC/RagA subfamily outer membrane receptor
LLKKCPLYKTKNMKRLLCILFFIAAATAFSQDFSDKWDKVIRFEEEGKIKSASAIVDNIYATAQQVRNEPQIIKCFFYRSKYMQTLEEEAQSKILKLLRQNIDEVSIPSKSLLEMVYAQCLKKYVQENHYKFYSRKTDPDSTGTFATWNNEDFKKEIRSAYDRSIANKAILRQTSMRNYEPVFDFLTLEKFKKENLYDYLLKEYIDYLSHQISTIFSAVPILNSDLLFADSATFIASDFSKLNDADALLIITFLKELEANDTSVEKQLYRIAFFGNPPYRNDDYFKALERIQKISESEIPSQEILLLKAYYFHEKASKKEFPDYFVKSVKLCDSILDIKNRSNAYRSALALKTGIQAKYLNLTMEKYTYPNQNTRVYVDYKSISNLAVSYYKINAALAQKLATEKNKDSLIAKIREAGPVKSSDYKIINKNDYFGYSTELLLPKIEKGTYLVYFESDGNHDNAKAFAWETVTVTDFSIAYGKHDNIDFYQIKDRRTGLPVKDVLIQTDAASVKTDRNGYAFSTNNKKELNLITLSKQEDTLSVFKHNPSGYYAYENSDDDDEFYEFDAELNIYLDRAIYRPGQTVYYKAIAITRLKNETSVIAHTKFAVTISDADGEDLKKFDIRSNEFGSFSGEFTIPNDVMTGEFEIRIEEPEDYNDDPVYNKKTEEHPFWDYTNFYEEDISFRVEEYKRPRFEAYFDDLKQHIGLNQNITVKGNCKSFDGSTMSGATVKYTIKREKYGSPYNSDAYGEGTITTDATGNFTIDFITAPLGDFDENTVFGYEINADITDLSGETHTAQTLIKAGSKTLLITTTVPELIMINDKNFITISTTNLNRRFIPVTGTLEVYFVKPDNKKFKKRSFPIPELPGFTDSEFEKLFPYEDNSSEGESWQDEKGTLVFSRKVNTAEERKIAVDFMSDFKSGNYRVGFSAVDANQNLITDSSFFSLKQSLAIDPSQLITIKQINKTPRQDGFVMFRLSSAIPELYINVAGFYESKRYFQNDIALHDHEFVIKIPINKEFRENVAFTFESIFENESYNFEKTIDLPEEVPLVKFGVESFRSKIQPGAIENWSFTIETEKTSNKMEVLASMYDRSLDEFEYKEWRDFRFPAHYSNTYESNILGFEQINLNLRNLNDDFPQINYRQENTELIWFGFDFNNKKTNLGLYKEQVTKKAKKPLNAGLIHGLVTDSSKLPLPGAMVTVKGTVRSTQTDFDGYYEIDAGQGEELEFSYAGSVTQTLLVDSREINAVLKDMALDAVVITTGYRKVAGNKSTMASSVMVVGQYNYSTSGIQSLQGQIAGLSVSYGSGQPGSGTYVLLRGANAVNGAAEPLIIVDGVPMEPGRLMKLNPADINSYEVLRDASATAIYGNRGANGVLIITTKKALAELSQVKTRKNFNETAFFLPNIKTDDKGKLSFSFTSPEALTQWRFRMLAHNRDGVLGHFEDIVTTQKDLMITPNIPRFFREKDTIVIAAKIANLSSTPKSGIAVLLLFDAATMKPVDTLAMNIESIRNFTVNPIGSTSVNWKITIPEGLQGIQYKVLAKTGDFSDGEENIIPVLTNSILVTESLPVWVRENSKKEYTLTNLKNNTSSTLRNHSLTFEYTSNPAWLAIQSLPYLMEYEHECAEQTFSRFYANAIAAKIISDNPKIAAVFEDWKAKGKSISELEQNETLKSIMLSETPWASDAKSEAGQKQRIALLFDLNKLSNSQAEILKKLTEKQKPSGGFGWFDGSDENEYITRHIVSGLGHLKKLGVAHSDEIKKIATGGIRYIDAKFSERAKIYANKRNRQSIFLGSNELHYLYARSSFLEEHPVGNDLKNHIALCLKNINTNWLQYTLYEKGMAALVSYRFGQKDFAKKILISLKETSSNNTDWGMYWIENKAGWYWYQAPIETQALLIEAFMEINNDTKSADAMKVWLLKNKQRKNWPTTKSTTEAIYALLMHGTDWLTIKDNTVIKIGDEKILTRKLSENAKEAETGYVKINWKPEEIKNDMATLSVENKSKVPGYGGFYWQYFEDIDQIKSVASPLSVTKTLFLKQEGKELQKIIGENPLKIGDLVTIRLVITAKEDMEYVHLKDLRASCFEPVDVLSGYDREGGLGYYKSTKDVATHFFFDSIAKGIYTFEYDVRVNNIGDFSGGIANIESMYAPEFAGHSKGSRINTTSNK